MKNLISLNDFSKQDIFEIFQIADDLQQGKYKDSLAGKTVVMFFPNASIRTRVTFEKGVYLLGGQTILFPPETLDKKEKLEDVAEYLNNWADVVVIRHNSIDLLREVAKYSKTPVINAMTDVNHPCEVLADVYSLSKRRPDFIKDKYMFVGRKGNIGLAWQEIAKVLGLDMCQCCPEGYEMPDMETVRDIKDAMKGTDIVCTDSLPSDILKDFETYQITTEFMELANVGALLNPCPPFFRGEEVAAEVIDSDYFVGYDFKKYLLEIQQAIIIFCMLKD